MLSRIKIKNFKSFAEAEIRLRPLTVMIGANASGKTNFIEALGLLGWMAKGRPLSQVYSAVRDGELRLRGWPRVTQHANDRPVGFEVDIDVGANACPRLELELSAQTGLLMSERLTVPGEASPVYELASEHQARFPKGQDVVLVGREADRPVFTHALPSEISRKDIVLLEYLLKSISIFHPVPDLMRGYANSRDGKYLHSSGSNISAVLENLCQSGFQAQILEFIRTLPEQDVRNVDFIRVPGPDDIMVKLLESFGDQEHWYEAAVLSDGTLRALAIAAALFNSESLLIIEDIDDGIHPSRLGRMLELLRHHAKQENISVLVTTHNPALLDALPDSELRHVVACYRDPEQGGSRLIALGQLHEFPGLVAQGPLGQLVTEGILDSALKHDRTDEERIASAIRWLDELEASK
jgi:energy-coupling factor transporter ATP-binding protein EcfA2